MNFEQFKRNFPMKKKTRTKTVLAMKSNKKYLQYRLKSGEIIYGY